MTDIGTNKSAMATLSMKTLEEVHFLLLWCLSVKVICKQLSMIAMTDKMGTIIIS